MVYGNIKPSEPDFKSADKIFDKKPVSKINVFGIFKTTFSFGDPEFSGFFMIFGGLSLVKEINSIYIIRIKKFEIKLYKTIKTGGI